MFGKPYPLALPGYIRPAAPVRGASWFVHRLPLIVQYWSGGQSLGLKSLSLQQKQLQAFERLFLLQAPEDKAHTKVLVVRLS